MTHRVDTPVELNDELTADDGPDAFFPRSVCRVHEALFEDGRSYRINLDSDQFDAYVRIEDGNGKLLAFDQDSGGGRNAQLTFRAHRAGVYRIIVTAFDGRTGEYRLQLRPE
jgi:serine protease Do